MGNISAMAREDPLFRLRMPEELKKQLEKQARQNKRSLNAEILCLIEEATQRPAGVLPINEIAGAYHASLLTVAQQQAVDNLITAFTAPSLNLVLVDRISRNLDAKLKASGKTITEEERIGIIQQLYDKYTGGDATDDDIRKAIGSAAA